MPRTTVPEVSLWERRKWWLIGGVLISLGIAGAIWFGLSATVGRVQWVTVGYKVFDQRRVDVRFDIDMPPGSRAVCTVRALAKDYSTVGSREVEIPAAPERTTGHEATVETTSEAVTGVVQYCRKL